MGTVDQGPRETITQDLKVTLHDSALVFPSQETERKSMFLSNIDKVLNFDVQTVHFFAAHPIYPFDIVVDKLKSALAKVLVPYDFLAGRLKLNTELGRLEIDCNAAGVVFMVASSEFSLNEIGDLVYPNPAFEQLVVKKLDKFGTDDQPLLNVQVTSFKCGGFAMGISNNHVTFDGISFKIFLENFASKAFHDKQLAVSPCNERQLLAARSPPRITFPHPELVKFKLPIGEESRAPVFDCQPEDLDFKIFRLSSDDIAYLKEKAKPDGTSTKAKITGFNVASAHIWRCKALSSCDTEIGLDQPYTILYSVDIRSRLRPPLPPSYSGNAVLTAYASAQCKELQEGPFSRLVEMVSEGSSRMTDEYARSAIDWGQVYKGFPHGNFLISSWWRLGFSEVEFPWGKPRYSCPVVYHRKDIILLFPEIDTVSNTSVNVLVALPAKEMEKFQTIFQKFLA